jgi:hypothetical protein
LAKDSLLSASKNDSDEDWFIRIRYYYLLFK